MKLYIGGDVSPTECTSSGFASGDVASLFGSVAELVKDGECFIVNLECAVTDKDTPIRKMGPNLRAPIETAATLKSAGVTVAGLSNNHVFDYGMPGFDDTKRYLSEAGIAFTGEGPTEQAARVPLFLRIGGKTLALICVCEHEYSYALPHREGSWAFDPFETMEDVSQARHDSDFVIVLYHGGKEQCEVPSPRLRKACRALVRAGADLVLCQHSHCIGSEETYLDKRIVYGQGNFHFVKNTAHPHWCSGLLLELELTPTGPVFTWHPVVPTPTGITLAEGVRREEILDGFAQRSAWLQDGTWLEKWHEFCEGERDYYTRAITGNLADMFPEMPVEQLHQFFPHFLDCEAHEDVWHELFPSWHGEGTDEVL